jgi:hypothetical protein
MKKVCAAVVVVGAILTPGIFARGQSGKITNAFSFGLDVGENAPSFTLKDQFGHKQSNETLQGTNGTVLLFVRSADL